MSEHTPGPWKAIDRNASRAFNQISIRPVNPAVRVMVLPIAAVNRFDLSEEGGGCGEANARLIAAAPDLLLALMKIASCEQEDSALGRIARSAISKATGSTHE